MATDFKLFGNLVQSPETIIIMAFLFLLIIIILFKLDKVEKTIIKLVKETEELSKKVKELEKEEEELIDGNFDIIDKFLSQKGYQINPIKGNQKKQANESIKPPKISNILNPKNEGEDNE